ncbi:hypothetical protein [Streptomyces sp. NBC_00728]|jgi:hypothetical protein|uniref:hypothetical protein n=1 Tax=Streptomyces sp. NBC_00728 TaxID=2903676 RepID=UPI0038646770
MSELIVKQSDGLHKAATTIRELAAHIDNIGKSLLAAREANNGVEGNDDTGNAFREQFDPGAKDLHSATTAHKQGLLSTADNVNSMRIYLDTAEDGAKQAAQKLNSAGHAVAVNTPSPHSASKPKR